MPFQNQVLKKLFKGILQDRSVEFNSDLTEYSSIGKAVKYLPISLSNRQKDALYNAWQREISYIQGPPGTGKSYTIVAIMISALLLNKKVLFVSQKKAAIDVVREKLEEFLGKNTVIYVGSETQERRQLQAYIEAKSSEVNAHDLLNHISQKKQDLDSLHQEIVNLDQGLTNRRDQLKRALDTEHEFYRANDLYLNERKHFADIFGLDYTKQLDLRQEAIHELGQNWFMENIGKIREKLASGDLKRKDFIYIRRFYKRCVSSLNADRNRFSRNELGQITLYLELLFKMNSAYAESVSIRRRINPSLSQIRRVIKQQEQVLLDKNKQYIKQLIEYQFIINLRHNQDVTDAFRRLLSWRNQARILESMNRISYSELTNVFPLWTGEIKDLGQFLPFQSEIFDLVIVDEASQVNIAEVIPAFYRGKSFCVVGDDKQLSLNAAGLFSLNRRFERLIWNRCFAGLNQVISYDRAEGKDLIVRALPTAW